MERRNNRGKCFRGNGHVADGAVRGGEAGMTFDIVMTLSRWKKNENGELVGDNPQYAQIRGKTATEINQTVAGMRLNNDVVKFTPWQFVRLDSVEVV